jgi:pyrroloquinoline quinone biosynthesis protein D
MSEDAKKPRIAAKARLRHDKVENRTLLVFPEAAMALNPTAAAVLELCDGSRTVPEIVASLAEKFAPADPKEIGAHVDELLSRLGQRGLIEDA